MDRLGAGSGPSDEQGWDQWRAFEARARLFVKSIEQRWETLYELMVCLIDFQRDFLVDGEIRLRPLTRARVADMMGVHESTVSRAVADKYVQLPCGEVVRLEKFFDSAAPIKRRIEDLVAQESEPLSDSALAEKLSEEGYDVARRTVAKYRNALGILPYSLRRRRKNLSS
jgi:RNA polymerase sigma-54 factor